MMTTRAFDRGFGEAEAGPARGCPWSHLALVSALTGERVGSDTVDVQQVVDTVEAPVPHTMEHDLLSAHAADAIEQHELRHARRVDVDDGRHRPRDGFRGLDDQCAHAQPREQDQRYGTARDDEQTPAAVGLR